MTKGAAMPITTNHHFKTTIMANFLGKILGAGAKETIDAVGNLIDTIDKSDEKLELQYKYKELLISIESEIIHYQSKLVESQSKIIVAEAKGESWLQRNWRPMLMLICMFIVCSNYILVPFFDIPCVTLDEHIWGLMELGVGGYVVGRSVEKVTENLGHVLQNTKTKTVRE